MMTIDIILVVFTAACTFYCMILNKRILQLQDFKDKMTDTLENFRKDTARMEQSMQNLYSAVQLSYSEIKEVSHTTKNTVEEFRGILSKADDLAQELELLVVSANNTAQRLENSKKEIAQSDNKETTEASANDSVVIDIQAKEKTTKKTTKADKSQKYFELVQERQIKNAS